MRVEQQGKLAVAALVLLLMAVAACGGSTTATSSPSQGNVAGSAAAPTLAAAPGIVDPTNLGWPRTVSTKRGLVEIKAKPERVLTPSLGHAEILVSLIDTSRIAGIGKYAYDADYSNIADFAATIPGKSITRDAELIVSVDPDVVIVSAFAPVEFVEQLEATGMTVVQTEFDESISSIADNVRLLAYILGEVERGERLVEQVQRRLQFVADTIAGLPDDQRPGVMMLGYLSKWTGGSGTTDEDIISRAGGLNLPSREFEGYQEIGDEGVVAMNPEVLLLSADEVRNNDALNIFLNNPALTVVEAVSKRKVYAVERSYLYNLSHWRVRGVEEVAKILYPELFAGVEFPDFEVVPR